MAADPVGTSARDRSLPLLRRAGALEQRLVLLMAARLVLAGASLGIALALEAAVGDVDHPGRRGLYGTVAFAFLATALYGVALPRIRRPQGFAVLNIAADIAIVSSLVHFSGGPDSFFSFLYVVVAFYGALLFDRRGALISAGLGSASYGAVLLVAQLGIAGGGRPVAPTVLFAVWTLHAGAIGLAAALASFLAVELRRTGAALRERTHDLAALASVHRRIVDSLMSGLLTTDREGRVTSFNPEAERITGLSPVAALGLDVEEVLPGVKAVALGSERGAGPVRARLRSRARDGVERHLGIGAYVLRDAQGRPSGHVVIFQDVTEVVAMEDELRRSERLAAVGALSASIAHEIRNPLAAISGSIQLLHAGGPTGSGPQADRLMGIVLRETDRLDRLIGDFLGYARPAPLRLESVALAPLCADLVQMLATSVDAGVEIERDVPEELAVWADSAQLRQVLWNLALNGCQAMPSGGRLSISAASASGEAPQEADGPRRNDGDKEAWVEICVRDEGVGIAPEILEQVFDPFFTTRSGGTGLGLATVHRIVGEHGGSLRLESVPGEGTLFRVRLPGAEAIA